MINHVRTLLGNMPPSGGETNIIGEEPADPSFKPVTLPGSLHRVRAVLFGETPDREFTNYRLWQFMTVLHNSEFKDYVTEFDGRITYGYRLGYPLFNGMTFTPSVYTIGTYTNAGIRLGGTPAVPDHDGIMTRTYEVEVSGDNAEVTAIIPSTIYPQDIVPVTGDIPLRGAGYVARISNPVEGARWNVQIRLRPTFDLGSLVKNIENIGQEHIEHLFNFHQAEPYKTYYNLFRMSEVTVERLTGILLALAYRTETLR